MDHVKAGVVVFPGSNCDHDVYNVFRHNLNADTKFLWHKDTDLGDRNIIILPDGLTPLLMVLNEDAADEATPPAEAPAKPRAATPSSA